MRFYNIKEEYIAYLRQYDSKVADNKNETRPYMGVVFEINNKKYYAPFSSPKPKHLCMKNGKDFRKIAQGKLGAINFNNMIPVVDEALILVDIDKITDEAYRSLLREQYKYIKADEKNIIKNAAQLHKLVTSSNEKLSENERIVKQRCCDFVLLESVSCKYNHTKMFISYRRLSR